ncbi:MAG: RNA polymerase sigma-70 factor [Prevotellaceae bacterium]|nr:RNA polymerase sigma-70 factor [Prevotellaceae bacterium]
MDKKQLDNSQIITRLRAGDEHFFEIVYKAYFAGLCAFSSQYVSLEEAREIVQETMLWLWENRAALIPELSLKSLLFTIVKHKSLNRATQGSTQTKVRRKIEEKFRLQFDDPDFYLSNELMALFREALQKLPEAYRQAFEMNRFEGLTHKEIAERLQVSPQTVNYRIGQALKCLRKELKDYLPLSLLLFAMLQRSGDEHTGMYRSFFSSIKHLFY